VAVIFLGVSGSNSCMTPRNVPLLYDTNNRPLLVLRGGTPTYAPDARQETNTTAPSMQKVSKSVSHTLWTQVLGDCGGGEGGEGGGRTAHGEDAGNRDAWIGIAENCENKKDESGIGSRDLGEGGVTERMHRSLSGGLAGLQETMRSGENTSTHHKYIYIYIYMYIYMHVCMYVCMLTMTVVVGREVVKRIIYMLYMYMLYRDIFYICYIYMLYMLYIYIHIHTHTYIYTYIHICMLTQP
jgi:hypothetical protein